MLSADAVGNDYINNVSFLTYSNDDILKISVKQITQPMTVTNLGVPITGGLLDSSLGATDINNVCSTCRLTEKYCPGHFGHISLSLPVFNPLFFKLLQNFLRGTCFFCHQPYIKNFVKAKFLTQYKLLMEAKFEEFEQLELLINRWTRKMMKRLQQTQEPLSMIEELVVAKIERFYTKLTQNKINIQSSNNVQMLTSIVIDRMDEYLRGFMNGTFLDNSGKFCNHCKLPKLKLHSEFSTIFMLKPTRCDSNQYGHILNNLSNEFLENSSIKINNETFIKTHYLTPLDVKKHLKLVWEKHADLLCTVMNRPLSNNVVDSFFMDNVLVIPPKFRPVSVFGDTKYENPMTSIYIKIITASYLLNETLNAMDDGAVQHERIKLKVHVLGRNLVGKASFDKIQAAWNQLQSNINSLADSELSKSSSIDKVAGIRQILEKKEGLFRMHMMGKRVNYAARSVITPDPYLDVDEVGLPEIFATKLTYPEPVTDMNFHRLKNAVRNGPSQYPGANMLEKSSGHRIFIQANRPNQREAQARQLMKDCDEKKPTSTTLHYKRVYRHVINGDIVLMNRQPTLHRPSIMAHKVRVLPKEKTIRMHYANCKSYNADFDGDEMNSHLPQNELARSEAYNLVATSKHYLSPRDGKPLTGLIQDYMISGVLLTMQDKFFTKDQYHQLVYSAFIDFPGRIKTLPPVILKPCQLWTGKSIISTIMLNITPSNRDLININSTSKISEKLWNIELKDPIIKEMTDDQVIIRNGELLTGILDKNQFGASSYGVIHSFYEVYSGFIGTKLLSVLGRLFISYLQVHGFTLGIEDTICIEAAQAARNDLIEQSKLCGDDILKSAFNINSNLSSTELVRLYRMYYYKNQEDKLNEVEFFTKNQTNNFQNKINNVCIPNGLIKRFPYNNLQLMIQSGAKGTAVNAMQISCLLGQIELEGKRPPRMSTGKNLPCFEPFDPSIASGGFTCSSFLSGLQPNEFFFHCMAGREGLVDTAVKTSRSGYLQRCLIKHMEGVTVNYDLSVRDSDGSVIQFLYGEDGCDTTKIHFAFDGRFDLLSMNYMNFYHELNVDYAKKLLDGKKALKYFKTVEKAYKRYSHYRSGSNVGSSNYRIIGYHGDFNHKKPSCFQQFCLESNIFSNTPFERYRAWHQLNQEDKENYRLKTCGCPLPVLACYTPSHYLGSVSEMFNDLSKGFIKKELSKRYSATVVNVNDTNYSDTNILKPPLKSNIKWKCERKLFTKLIKLKYIKSLIDPGESVGILAGQSVGEPSTQMTLNTFHFAGRGEMNVTLGIPRLREILLVGSSKIKTPTVSVPVLSCNPQAIQMAKVLEKKLTPISFSKFLRNVVLTHNKLYDPSQKYLVRTFSIKFHFLPKKVLKHEYNTNCKKLVLFAEKIFIKKLAAELNKTIKYKKNFFIVNEEKSITNDTTHNNANESVANKEKSDEKIEYDASLLDLKNNDNRDNISIESSSGNEIEDYGDISDDSCPNEVEQNNLSDVDNHLINTINEHHTNDIHKTNYIESLLESDNDDTTLLKNISMVGSSSIKHSNQQKAHRVKSMLETYPFLSGYNYDDNDYKWFEICFELPATLSKTFINPLIKRVSDITKYNYVIDIKRCFVKCLPSNNPHKITPSYILTLEGDNIRELWKYEKYLALNQLYCNNIQRMAYLYGIEAARVVLIKEIQNVFGAYGITVNYRHLTLLADYMTFKGVYSSFNRFSLTSCSSPFQKMSYETTMNFLRYACSYGQNDTIESPSARLVIGRPVHTGTDFFNILTKLDMNQKVDVRY